MCRWSLLLGVLVVCAVSTSARADDVWESIDGLGQIGLGAALVDDEWAFDGTLRLGRASSITDHVRAGGFVELRTVDAGTLEGAVGPQVQLRLAGTTAIQLRGGIGSATSGDPYSVVGVRIGNDLVGVGVTARRPFGTDEHPQYAMNLELSSMLVLAPILVALTNDDD
jgi:hypothetical protein